MFSLWLSLFILSGVLSPLFSSSILGTYWPVEFIFQCHIFCLFILFMGFSRQAYWNDLPFPSPGDLPDPGIEAVSPALAGGYFIMELPGKPSSYNRLRWAPTAQRRAQSTVSGGAIRVDPWWRVTSAIPCSYHRLAAYRKVVCKGLSADICWFLPLQSKMKWIIKNQCISLKLTLCHLRISLSS